MNAARFESSFVNSSVTNGYDVLLFDVYVFVLLICYFIWFVNLFFGIFVVFMDFGCLFFASNCGKYTGFFSFVGACFLKFVLFGMYSIFFFDVSI